MTSETTRPVRGFGPSRAQVLAHLRGTGGAEPEVTIASAVGLHENPTRFPLEALVDVGLAHREPKDAPS